ncbi:DUF4279 domain-containing protein [Caballeronia sp. LZ034LL]|uniref:DUF4279 domain-containing protein n=1 Tax=Caballeronia sp. LZ034LL TaxID=3038567 RepID=UPI00285A3CBD|nr:DUF4279 domain-containing protein [Caballeronia sp. LZ034LL]MDR5833489.1 DUF4279 domain-containing protein [Caballeronia sp. LZ034LL]
MATHDEQLAYASFTISGDGVDPAFWTKYFQQQPDVARMKGERMRPPAGKLYAERPIGFWGVRTKGRVRSDLLALHLWYLKTSLALPRRDLPELLEQANAKMRFFCYWVNESGNRIPDIPEPIRTMMEGMGGTIEIDEYRW